KEEPIKSWSSYDGYPRSFAQQPPAHDFSLECEIEVVAANAGASFACRLRDGADAVSTEIAVGARADGRADLNHDEHGPLQSAGRISLRPGHRHLVEFAFVDRRATFALDGTVI